MSAVPPKSDQPSMEVSEEVTPSSPREAEIISKEPEVDIASAKKAHSPNASLALIDLEPKLKRSESLDGLCPSGEQELNYEERQHLEALKRQLPEDVAKECDEWALLRFLVAREWRVREAAEMITHDARVRRWRDLRGLALRPSRTAELVGRLMGRGIDGGVFGRDLLGYPVCYMEQGAFVSLPLHTVLTMEQFFEYHVYQWARTLEAARRACEQDGKPKQMLLVIDVSALSLESRHNRRFLQHVAELDEKHYPEFFYKIVIVGCPRVFPVLYQIIRPFIPTRTKAKIRVNTESAAQVLPRYIDMDQVPEAFGGRAPNETSYVAPDLTALEELKEMRAQRLPPQQERELQQVEISAGAEEIFEFECKKDQVVNWWFKVESHNVLLYVRFSFADRSEPDWQVRDKEKMGDEGDGVRVFPCEGAFTAPADGKLTVVFSNKHSRWPKKRVLYRFGSGSGSPSGGGGGEAESEGVKETEEEEERKDDTT